MAIDDLPWEIMVKDIVPLFEEALDEFVENHPEHTIKSVAIRTNIYDGEPGLALFAHFDEEDEEELANTDDMADIWVPLAQPLGEATEDTDEDYEFGGELEPVARFFLAVWEMLEELQTTDVVQFLIEEFSTSLELIDDFGVPRDEESIEKMRYDLALEL